MSQLVGSLFVWALGLCVGSFLNVVVYRLSAGGSIASPRWSFCPRCRATIRWHDNIPVLSWLLLGARCRDCRAPISVQYPLVEAATGLAFALVYDLLFVGQMRSGTVAVLPADLPLLVAWLVLTASLVACSAMDIVSYSIDIRITNFAVIVGVAAHALWPRAEFMVAPASTGFGAACAAALFVGLLVWAIRARGHAGAGDTSDEVEPVDEHATGAPTETAAARAAGVVGTLVCVAGAGVLIAAATGAAVGYGAALVVGALVVLFALVVFAGGHSRDADLEIAEAIEEESGSARRVAGVELLWLLPAVIAGVVAMVGVERLGAVGDAWRSIVALTVGGCVPVAGVVVALKGLAVAAAAGWFLRIVFTFVYGREALGVGDIYILAAAGACAGWKIALLGLLLSVGFALLGWAVGLMLKRSTMIPLGPWLAIGFIAALAIERPASELAALQVGALRDLWTHRPDVVFVLIGVLLVASVAAVYVSRVLRNLVEPAPQQAAAEPSDRPADGE